MSLPVVPKDPKPFFFAALLVVLPFKANIALAESWFYRNPVKISAGSQFYAATRDYSDDTEARDDGGSLYLELYQDGYILDPKIAFFSMQVEPRYRWNNLEQISGGGEPWPVEDTKEDGLDYSFRLDLFRGAPQPFDAYFVTQKTTGLTTGTLGSRYDTTFQSTSATVNWNNRAFPMSLQYKENTYQYYYLSGLSSTVTERDEVRKTLSLLGKSSKSRLLIEHEALDDRLAGQDRDYNLSTIDIDHKFPWGRASRLDSKLRYTDRKGFQNKQQLVFREDAHIYHTNKVQSRAHYGFTSVSQQLRTSQHYGRYHLSHKLYRNLSTGVFVGGSLLDSDFTRESTWSSGLNSSYNKSFFSNFFLNAGVAVGYDETDRKSDSGVVEVIDEPHVIPLSGLVLLARQFIDAATIVVTNNDGTLVYSEGVDYTLVKVANDLTQLQTVPGGRITPGETILVSYKAIALPSQEFSVTNTGYNLGLSIGNFRATHQSYKFDYSLLAGTPITFLEDRRDDTTVIEYSWKMGGTDAFLSATRQYAEFGEFETTTYLAQQSLRWSLFNVTFWDLVFAQAFTESQDRRSESYSFSLAASWAPLSGLSVRSRLGVWKRVDEDRTGFASDREDTFANFGTTVDWRVRSFNLKFEYTYNDWRSHEWFFSPAKYKEDASREHRVMIDLRRRFW